MKKSKRIAVRITERFHERLEKAMRFEGISKTELVTIAIKEYIEKVEKKYPPN